ncbi:hypothetical protein GALL_132150 [mine drainage metagenome]|uniref:Uncharacterized protein n=1 Tax=mine drainage metagenome TaxID=410659 RepID=A0A1J5S7T6_9ZZZZ
MDKVLIISDNLTMAHVIETKFSNVGWSNQSISVLSMMGRNSSSANNYQCMILVIDTDFRKRFGSIIDEMTAIIRNGSLHTTLYLMFEGDYDPRFASWLEYSKTIFKLSMHHHNLLKAINEITRLESGIVSRAAFCSPMDSI